MKIAMIGNGIIGGAMSKWLKQNTDHDVMIHDPAKGSECDYTSADVAFIQIPVDTTKTGHQFTAPLKAYCKELVAAGVDTFVRSTVLPGTCDDYGVISMPEFLTSRTADRDFREQPVLAGGGEQTLNAVFQGKKQVIVTSNTGAEMAKYTHNGFLAVKNWWFNSIYEVCEERKINYDDVQIGSTLSGLVTDAQTYVPGPDGQFGYAGHCLPKDLSALIQFMRYAPIVDRIRQDNERLRKRRVEREVYAAAREREKERVKREGQDEAQGQEKGQRQEGLLSRKRRVFDSQTRA